MKESIVILLFASLIAFFSCSRGGDEHSMHGKKNSGSNDLPVIPGPGKKVEINKDFYFTYEFSQKPAMGMLTIKIELFTSDGKPSTALTAVGNSSMPAMKGAHDSGDVEFKLNKKGYYLLPVNVVMPGEWEVKVKFLQDKKAIYEGKIGFDV